MVEYGFAGVQSNGPVAMSVTQQASVAGSVGDAFNIRFSEAGDFVDPRGCVSCCAGGWVFEGLVGSNWQPMTTVNHSGTDIALTINRGEDEPPVVSVRYAWARLPECVMMSSASGLPAAPFVMDVSVSS